VTANVIVTDSTFTANAALGGNGGNFNNGAGSNAKGGSIYFEGGTLNVTGSLIEGSGATGGNGGNQDQNGQTNGGFGGTAQGGGVWVSGGTLLTINNTTFDSNEANGGNSGTGGNGANPGGNAEGGGLYSLGNVTLTKEDTRATWGWQLEALIQDLRLGFRLLGRNRAFAAFSVLSLALGVGGTSAVFSLFEAIVLRQLPVREPERLVVLSFILPGQPPNSTLPYPHFDRMRSEARTLDDLFAWTTVPRISVGFGGRTELAAAAGVTGEYHRALGLRPAFGRLLTPEDARNRTVHQEELDSLLR
jgi:hypothetical protein